MDSLSQLKDIKPIVEVPDYSLYIFICLVGVVLLGIGYGLYRYFTRVKKTKQPTPKELSWQKLQNLDFTNTKDVVYSFSLECEKFLDEANKTRFETIVKKLEKYKYKKDIEVLSKDLEEEIKEFIKGLRC